MRKEKLMERKRKIASGKHDCPEFYMTDDILKMFSEKQILTVMEIVRTVKSAESERSPFITLSADEVLQKSSGRIARFLPDDVVEETRQEVMEGAACVVLEKYERGEEK